MDNTGAPNGTNTRGHLASPCASSSKVAQAHSAEHSGYPFLVHGMHGKSLGFDILGF
jgi:hypothetical protein